MVVLEGNYNFLIHLILYNIILSYFPKKQKNVYHYCFWNFGSLATRSWKGTLSSSPCPSTTPKTQFSGLRTFLERVITKSKFDVESRILRSDIFGRVLHSILIMVLALDYLHYFTIKWMIIEWQGDCHCLDVRRFFSLSMHVCRMFVRMTACLNWLMVGLLEWVYCFWEQAIIVASARLGG